MKIGRQDKLQGYEEITQENGLILKTVSKTFTIYTQTLHEAELWVRILSLIAVMNRRGVCYAKVNPSDFERLLDH